MNVAVVVVVGYAATVVGENAVDASAPALAAVPAVLPVVADDNTAPLDVVAAAPAVLAAAEAGNELENAVDSAAGHAAVAGVPLCAVASVVVMPQHVERAPVPHLLIAPTLVIP